MTLVERIFEGRKASAGLMLLSSPLMCIPHYANHHHILCCLASAPVQQSVSDLAPPLLSPPEQIDFCVRRDFLPCWRLSSSPLSTCNPTLRCPSRLLCPRVTVHSYGPRSGQLHRVSASARRARSLPRGHLWHLADGQPPSQCGGLHCPPCW